MAVETKTRTLTYKHATFHEPGPQLARLLRAAFLKATKVGERRESLAPDDESPIWRVVGQRVAEAEWVFGVLMRYAPGTNGQFVVDDPAAVALSVEQLSAPPTRSGKRRELLDSVLYFGVLENHVVVLQSGLRAGQLEQHLQWLLHSTKVLPGTNTLKLVDQPTKKVRDTLKTHPVKSISVGGDIDAAPATPEDGSKSAVTLRESKSVSVHSAGRGSGVMDLIRGLIEPDKAAKLDLGALAGSNFTYTLTLTYDRKTTDGGQKLMNALGVAFRDVDEVDTTLNLVGGGKIKGRDLRVSGPVRLNTVDGVPSTDAVFETIRRWLLDKVQSEDVPSS